MMQEESFPRGCRTATKNTKPKKKFYKQENLFGFKYGNESKKKKAKRQRIEAHKTKLEEDVGLPVVEPQVLTHRTIKTDMIILGNVRSVSIVAAEVELPGRIYGYLKIGETSDVLIERVTAQLKRTNVDEEQDDEQELVLSNFFEVGQFIPVKVLHIESIDKNKKIELSTKPNVINSDLNYTTFRKQMLVWATVIEKLEHGYRLDVGVENVRVFLQNEKVPENINYKVGQNVWCVIHNCDIQSSATTLKVSTLQKHIDSAIEYETDRSLHTVLPGMQFKFDIIKLSKNGLLGEFLNESKAYVHNMYLQKPLQSIHEFKEGQEVKGRVLYIEPITKFVFITLRGIETIAKTELKIGEILSSKVLGRTNGGIYLQLTDTAKGFVTFRRILNSLGKETINDITDIVKEKYPKGKMVKCRILDYNRLDAVYICTVETSVINEKFFTKDDLVSGQLVIVHVAEIKDDGLVVKFGHLQGFIDNLHLSNAQYSENIKSKFRVNQKLKARVLTILNNSIRLTAKPALVESDLCLTSLEQAETGEQFPGVVIRRSKFGALVAFYSDLKGFLPCTELLPGETADARELLFDGQVVNASVTNKDGENIHLSLIAVKEDDNKEDTEEIIQKSQSKSKQEKKPKATKLKIGQEVSGIITRVQAKGLHIKIDGKDVEAFMPLHHLSVNYDLNSALLDTYAVNDKIENLLCIETGRNGPLVSLRESIANKRQKLSIPKKLKPGDIVRGYYIANDDRTIRMCIPTKTGTHTVEMSEENLFSTPDILNHLHFAENQAFVLKIISVGKRIVVSGKEIDVSGSSVEHSLFWLEQYMLNIQRIGLHLMKSCDPLSALSLGERVRGVVTAVGENCRCQVLLENGSVGIVEPLHSLDDIKPGNKVEAVVLWVNYTERYVDISLKPDIVSRINENQDACIDKSFHCETMGIVILVKEYFVLCTSDLNKQLVFLPTVVHENVVYSLKSNYERLYFYPICIKVYNKVAGKLIGFERSFEKELSHIDAILAEKQEEATDAEKNKLLDSVEEPEINEKFISDIETAESNFEEEIESGKTNGTKRKLETEITEQQNKKNTCKKQKVEILFPSMANFFEISEDDSNDNKREEESSDDDNIKVEGKKKKKLTAAERAELARKEEERLRQIENELADPNKIPESAEQFERLALANPNSSKIWSQYIAFHLSMAEVEKARIVAKRALETIDIEKNQDKLNIWVAYLNLENMFGTKESFEKVFEEATKCNEPYDIYLEAIKIFAQTKKFELMEEKMQKFRAKFKGSSKTWIHIAKVYYELKRFEEARKLKERALKSISDKKQHIDMMVQFAIMEFKYGEQNQGEVLFETILSSYPERVDVWSSYVDQLVKKGCIDLARHVLERATSQRLNMVKMRSIFKKFRDFEKVHGTEETLQQVKDALNDYVTRVVGKNVEK